jgi:hypothetical protein
LIRVMLHRRHPNQPLPAVRTLQRWFQRADLSPAPVAAIFPGLLIFNHPCVVRQIPISSDDVRPL